MVITWIGFLLAIHRGFLVELAARTVNSGAGSMCMGVSESLTVNNLVGTLFLCGEGGVSVGTFFCAKMKTRAFSEWHDGLGIVGNSEVNMLLQCSGVSGLEPELIEMGDAWLLFLSSLTAGRGTVNFLVRFMGPDMWPEWDTVMLLASSPRVSDNGVFSR